MDKQFSICVNSAGCLPDSESYPYVVGMDELELSNQTRNVKADVTDLRGNVSTLLVYELDGLHTLNIERLSDSDMQALEAENKTMMAGQ